MITLAHADVINGLLEFVGGVALWANVRRLLIDREVKGVQWQSVSFFWAWAAWTIYWYPALGQWWSFVGACWMLAANTAWMGLLIYYSYNPKGHR